MQQGLSIPEIVTADHDEAVVHRKVVRMIRLSEYKRRQSPVGIRVTHRGSDAIGGIRSPIAFARNVSRSRIGATKSDQLAQRKAEATMKQITAIIKPFKLDEVRGGAGRRRDRVDGNRSQRVWSPEGPHRALPWR